jgi:hypothetical protein
MAWVWAAQVLLADGEPILNRTGAGCSPNGRIPRSCLPHSNARGRRRELRGVLSGGLAEEARLTKSQDDA